MNRSALLHLHLAPPTSTQPLLLPTSASHLSLLPMPLTSASHLCPSPLRLLHHLLRGPLQTLETPFMAKTVFELIPTPEKVAEYISEELSPNARSFVLGLLSVEPHQRLGTSGGATQVQAHSFFKGLDWEALMQLELPAPFRPLDCPAGGHRSSSR